MPGFTDEFMASLGPQVSKELSKNLGINQNIAQQILPAVIPMILGGLKKQKDEYGGEARVDHILNKYGSANALNNISGLFQSKAKDTSVDASLGGLLGNSGLQATDMIAKQFNLDKNTASKLIPMLAPIVLGALTKKRDTAGAGSKGIASLLDRDGDTSILNNVAGFLLKNAFSGGQKGESALGSVLGSLFGKKLK
jgi:hypothetical protein